MPTSIPVISKSPSRLPIPPRSPAPASKPLPIPGVRHGATTRTTADNTRLTPSPPLPSPSVVSSASPRLPSQSRLPKSPGSKLTTQKSSNTPVSKDATTLSPPPAPKALVKQADANNSMSPRTPLTGQRRPGHKRSPGVTTTVSPSSVDKAGVPEKKACHETTLTQADPSPKAVRPENSPYVGSAHLGQPCTLKALDHALNCGHKIITTQPEACAKNCQRPHSAHTNPNSLDNPFTCLVCIFAEQSKKHDERVEEFRSELEQVAKFTKKDDPEQWIQAKIGFMEKAWRDLQSEEIREQAKGGRFCYPVFIAAEYETLMLVIVSERLRSTARAKLSSSKAGAETSASEESVAVEKVSSNKPSSALSVIEE